MFVSGKERNSASEKNIWWFSPSSFNQYLIKSTFTLSKVAVWMKHCFVWNEAVIYWWPNLRVYSKQQLFEEESLQVLVLWNHLLLHKPVCVPLHGLSFNHKQITSFHYHRGALIFGKKLGVSLNSGEGSFANFTFCQDLPKHNLPWNCPKIWWKTY